MFRVLVDLLRLLDYYPKCFIEKEIKRILKEMENTPDNSNKEKTEGIAKLFLPYERGSSENLSVLRQPIPPLWIPPLSNMRGA